MRTIVYNVDGPLRMDLRTEKFSFQFMFLWK